MSMDLADLSSSCTDPLSPPQHRDIRSATRTVNFRRKASQKYYSYSGVKPSWVGQSYLYFPTKSTISRYEQQLRWTWDTVHAHNREGEVETKVWTKTDMYVHCGEGIWPLNYRHSVGKRKREWRSEGWEVKRLGRGMKDRRGRGTWDGAEVWGGDCCEALDEVVVDYTEVGKRDGEETNWELGGEDVVEEKKKIEAETEESDEDGVEGFEMVDIHELDEATSSDDDDWEYLPNTI